MLCIPRRILSEKDSSIGRIELLESMKDPSRTSHTILRRSLSSASLGSWSIPLLNLDRICYHSFVRESCVVSGKSWKGSWVTRIKSWKQKWSGFWTRSWANPMRIVLNQDPRWSFQGFLRNDQEWDQGYYPWNRNMAKDDEFYTRGKNLI